MNTRVRGISEQCKVDKPRWPRRNCGGGVAVAAAALGTMARSTCVAMLGIRQRLDVQGGRGRTTMDSVVVDMMPRFEATALAGLGCIRRSMWPVTWMWRVPLDTANVSSSAVVTVTGTE